MRSSHSRRRRPPAEVSPLTPAFTMRYSRPWLAIRSASSAGNASSEGNPYPAVRLVPRKSTTGRSSAAAAGGADAGASGCSESHANVQQIAQAMSAGSEYRRAPRPRTIDILMILARNLTQRYPRADGERPLTVLERVDLELRDGEAVAILGPSGSGKTTLLGLLAGLDQPSEGEVHLEGQCLAALDEDARAALRAERVGFVFQTFQLLPTLTALENVLVPLELLPGRRSLRAAAADRRARELLDRVGLAARLDHYPAQLSGGEQQRVGIARAFANEPRVLFADEPTGNLDRETGLEIADLLFDLNRELGTTLVIVTHDLALAQRAGRVIRLEAGRIAATETTGRTG